MQILSPVSRRPVLQAEYANGNIYIYSPVTGRLLHTIEPIGSNAGVYSPVTHRLLYILSPFTIPNIGSTGTPGTLPENGGVNHVPLDIPWNNFISGSRPDNMTVINNALSQVGNSTINNSGVAWWQWFGFASREPWCATFAYWAHRTVNNAPPYPTSGQANVASSWGTFSWFRDNGQAYGLGFSDLAAGDAIFFDWQHGGFPDRYGMLDHTGLVIGRTATHVWTVEGNSSNIVVVRSYPLDSPAISAYGIVV